MTTKAHEMFTRRVWSSPPTSKEDRSTLAPSSPDGEPGVVSMSELIRQNRLGLAERSARLSDKPAAES